MTTRLVWMDMEMTGLDLSRDVILEVATVITDEKLSVLDKTPNMVIYQPPEALDEMDEWNVQHHTESGLLEQVAQSEISLAEAEAVTLDMLSKHIEQRSAPLCGNSIWQDRRFLCKYMPTLEGFLHYRVVDVSSIKELARIWHPELLSQAKPKQNNHRAEEDIFESIAELKYYQQHFMRLPHA